MIINIICSVLMLASIGGGSSFLIMGGEGLSAHPVNWVKGIIGLGGSLLWSFVGAVAFVTMIVENRP